MTTHPTDDMVWPNRATALRRYFTPSAPVRNRELFAGRTDQMLRVVDTFSSPGEHAAIFGERGVGKTSLATIAEQLAHATGRLAVRVNLNATDRIVDVWNHVGEGMDRKFRVDQADGHQLDDLDGIIQGAVALLTSPNVRSHDVLVALEMLQGPGRTVVFLDEFDRLSDPDIETDLVDLMKTISDHGIEATIVVVGVADDVDSLIQEHQSIGRGLNQIEMPRMSADELHDALRLGLEQADMHVTDEASQLVTQLSTGLPHYVHLLGLHAGLVAVASEEAVLAVEHVLLALPTAVKRAQAHVSRLYQAATHSTRPNRFKEILLAAALTPTDENGYFAPGDLRAPMAVIGGKTATIPQFSDQLISFANDRGPVLQRTGVTNRPRYRMAEPLLAPYVAMRGVNEKIISPEKLRHLLGERAAGTPTPS